MKVTHRIALVRMTAVLCRMKLLKLEMDALTRLQRELRICATGALNMGINGFIPLTKPIASLLIQRQISIAKSSSVYILKFENLKNKTLH